MFRNFTRNKLQKRYFAVPMLDKKKGSNLQYNTTILKHFKEMCNDKKRAIKRKNFCCVNHWFDKNVQKGGST